MITLDLDDLKSRINPQYATTPGTESYERRLCVEEIEALRARVAELEAALRDLMVKDTIGKIDAAIDAARGKHEHGNLDRIYG
jgi:hypothetical protein